MNREVIPIEQREFEHELALRDLTAAAEAWLEARAEHGARMSRKLDETLDVAMADARRTGRRLGETRKRVERAA